MKLTLIGTSNYELEHPFASAGYIVQTKTTTLKLDFGRSNLTGMVHSGIDWKQLDAILISHVHPDHVSDLVQYLQLYTLYRDSGRLTKDIQLVGPEGFNNWFELLKQVVSTNWKHIPTTREVTNSTLSIGDAHIEVAPMKHVIPTVGYRIEANGTALCYTGDAAYSPELVTLAKNADVLLTECSATNEQETQVHMRPKDIARVAQEAKVKTVVLTHYPTDPATRKALADQVRAACKATVIAGSDNQVIEL